MAREDGSPKALGRSARRRTTVPVESRAADRRAQERANSRAQALAEKQGRSRMDIAGITVLIAVLLAILLAISMPLRNYYDGRAELARLEDSIAAKQAEKERLESALEQYQDPEFIRQEARRRLGLVEPGEVAYRIVDPRMTHESTVTTDQQAVDDSRQWYEVLWGSIAEERQVAVVSGNESGPSAPAAENTPAENTDADGDAPAGDAPAPQDGAPAEGQPAGEQAGEQPAAPAEAPAN